MNIEKTVESNNEELKSQIEENQDVEQIIDNNNVNKSNKFLPYLKKIAVFVDGPLTKGADKIFPGKGKRYIKYLKYGIPTLIILVIASFIEYYIRSESILKKEDFLDITKIQGRTFVTNTDYYASSNIYFKLMGIEELHFIYFIHFINSNKARIIRYRSTELKDKTYINLQKISDETLSYKRDFSSFSHLSEDPWIRKGIYRFANNLRIGECGIRKEDNEKDETVVLFHPNETTISSEILSTELKEFPEYLSNFSK